jgi:hypothetical protein
MAKYGKITHLNRVDELPWITYSAWPFSGTTRGSAGENYGNYEGFQKAWERQTATTQPTEPSLLDYTVPHKQPKSLQTSRYHKKPV